MRFPVQFEQPWWLLLVPISCLALGYSFRYLRGISKERKRLATVIRAVLVSVIALALSNPRLVLRNEGLATVFVIDQSDSITPTQKASLTKYVDTALANLKPNEEAAVVTFGKDAVIELPLAGKARFEKGQAVLNRSASDIAAAIRLASALLPENRSKRIVLLSDGNETLGDALAAVRAAESEGISIDVVAPDRKESAQEVAVVALEAPDDARPNQPFELRALFDSTTETQGELILDRDGVEISRTAVTISKGRSSVILKDQVPKGGFLRYRATLVASRDTDPRNNVSSAFVPIKDVPKVLVLQGPDAGNELRDALTRGEIEVEARTVGNLPLRPDEFIGYDAILLNNIEALAFPQATQRAIADACRVAGVGLAMIGGEDSFLPGGWYGSPVIDALPVDLDVRKKKNFPSTAICILVDASGSMGSIEDGFPKIRLAAKAAVETIRLMGHNDRLALGASSDGIEFVIPMQTLTDKDAAIAMTERLQINSGGIYVTPTMKKAFEVLNPEPSKVRHFILLADGNDSTDSEGAVALAAQMNLLKITTTVVAIGDGKDVPVLRQVAAAGGGQFYLATRASQLPAIFTQDAAIMSRSAIVEEPFVPTITARDAANKGFDSLPALTGYCLTETKPLATVSLESHRAEPIMMTMQSGLGTSMAFNSDATSKWASQWVGWDGFSTFWTQATRGIFRRTGDGSIQMTVRREGGQAKAIVTSQVPNRTAELMDLRISTPDGKATTTPLVPTGPGIYEGKFDASEFGTYVVSVGQPQAGGSVGITTAGLSVSYPPEYQTVENNLPLLEQIASEGGGKILPIDKPDLATRTPTKIGTSLREITPLLIALALFLLPIDIAVRRLVGWSPIRSKGAQPAPALDALRKRKADVVATRSNATRPEIHVPTISTPTEVRLPEAESSQETSAPSAATKLLDAQRKRRGPRSD